MFSILSQLPSLAKRLALERITALLSAQPIHIESLRHLQPLSHHRQQVRGDRQRSRLKHLSRGLRPQQVAIADILLPPVRPAHVVPTSTAPRPLPHAIQSVKHQHRSPRLRVVRLQTVALVHGTIPFLRVMLAIGPTVRSRLSLERISWLTGPLTFVRSISRAQIRSIHLTTSIHPITMRDLMMLPSYHGTQILIIAPLRLYGAQTRKR